MARVEPVIRDVRCRGITMDREQNLVFLNYGHRRVERVSNGTTTILASNVSSVLSSGVVIDRSGAVWVADSHRSVIRRIGQGETTDFKMECQPKALFMDEHEQLYYATDAQIFKWSPNGGSQIILGNGRRGNTDDRSASLIHINEPSGFCVDRDGTLYASDSFNKRILMVKNGLVTTLYHPLEYPFGIAQLPNGDLLVAESNANRVVRISLDGKSTVVAGEGSDESKFCDDPRCLCLDREGNAFVVSHQHDLVFKITFPARWSKGNSCQ